MQEPTRTDAANGGIHFYGISKSFGEVQALQTITTSIETGEIVGLAGHNGAGKSTLINLIMGIFRPNFGSIHAFGHELKSREDLSRIGIRCVFQELSLCANLTAAENTALVHSGHNPIAWRGEMERLLREKIDEIFPSNGVPLNIPIEDLTLAQRQMIEIARAFTETSYPVRLVILDEPTSSLGSEPTNQLLAHMKKVRDNGITVLFVTHRMKEMLEVSTRVLVMVDGGIAGDLSGSDLELDAIIGAMGQLDKHDDHAKQARRSYVKSETTIVDTQGTAAQGLGNFHISKGEIVGLAGLDGHGQKDVLEKVFDAAQGRDPDLTSSSNCTFVAGDRSAEGIFPLWSIGQNLGFAWLLNKFKSGLIDLKSERISQAEWVERLGVRTPDPDLPILSLSGGNQQKVLFGRAFMTDAELVILDDPMRGVDVGTKAEVYQMIKQQADQGRSFLWYATETAELSHCDRVYVMNEGNIVRELAGDEITEEAIIAASFQRLEGNAA